jgi:diadenosine tetraphosphatase ApaH/serine/threonine PP2A family protein phosphatase
VEAVRELPHLTSLLGNHDVAIIGQMSLSVFNGDARRSLIWQERVLTADNMDFLKSLPQNLKVRHEVSLVHGSPRDPIWEYILTTLSARLNLNHFDTPWCFVGHSHIQCMFQYDEENDRLSLEIPPPGQVLELKPRAILNPGSVGQPRDRDPRAAYAIYDPDAKTWEPRRVKYHIAEVQARIRQSGLPEKHALRLAEGW